MALIFLVAIIQLVCIEVEGTCIEWLAVLDHESEACCICLLPPTDIALGSTFLWADVWEILVVCIVAVDTYLHAVLTVGVVFDRTTAVVLALVHFVWQLHQHTEAEEIAYFLAFCSDEVLGHLYGTCVCHNLIDQFQLALYLWHIVVGADGIGIGLLVLLYGNSAQFQLRVLPYLEFLLESCTHVIICRSTPEVWLQGAAFAEE